MDENTPSLMYVYAVEYPPPRNSAREAAVVELAESYGGRLQDIDESGPVIEIWFEFPSAKAGDDAANALYRSGERVVDWGTWDAHD